jgi:hypothetical protein
MQKPIIINVVYIIRNTEKVGTIFKLNTATRILNYWRRFANGTSIALFLSL